MKIDIAGVAVDNLSKLEAVERVNQFVQSGQPHYIVTPYSELIVFALDSEEYRAILNGAALSLPDGVGVLWAAKYLSLLQSGLWPIVYTGTAIIFNRSYIRSVIQEQITGSRFVRDIAELAAAKGYSLSLVGGEQGVANKAAEQLLLQYPKLKINLAVSDEAFDQDMVNKIAQTNSDILLIAYLPPRQETWLAQNIQQLNVKVAIGLGGTFDYLAGKRSPAPDLVHQFGLEWLWRLITQPQRWKRMWNAIPVFVWKIYNYKKHVTRS